MALDRVGLGEDFEPVAGRIEGVEAAPAVVGVDLARQPALRIGGVRDSAVLDARERGVERVVVDEERVVLHLDLPRARASGRRAGAAAERASLGCVAMAGEQSGRRAFDVVIIGAGAAGLMCAMTAAARGRSVIVIESSNKPGKKILMSGGGRCNFTNMWAAPENYHSQQPNPQFHKSAMAGYSPWDFIAMVNEHGIPYHEKKLGQLFCDNRSKDILNMLLDRCEDAGVEIHVRTTVRAMRRVGDGYQLRTDIGELACESLVIATGGLSIPTLGSTGFGMEVAREFGHTILPTRAGLVPFTITDHRLSDLCNELSGTSADCTASCNGQRFRENLLFTHRGLSGPAILQISSFWHPGDTVTIDLLPDHDALEWLESRRAARPDAELRTVLGEVFTKKMASLLTDAWFTSKPMKRYTPGELRAIADQLGAWQLVPGGTEGYRTAEVMLGGVDTREVSSKTMESLKSPGLYFVGEVLDLTGHLGGFNFQWAWASGYAAAQYV
ncbi:MAG: NAD(P)/FAD-dependent oxidoreductase [Solirubrobacteraceae bacterium]|nr:NAD(P)/FAD-dependent oxidoreductase [Solirubrobacteraceae bacterium]